MDDVLVVGAGPTGCMLAGEVARAGHAVTVLERHAEISPLSRAFGVHARTLEVLDTRGLADELLATGAKASRLELWHKAELELCRLPSKFPFALVTPQTNVDQLLERYAIVQGATIQRNTSVSTIIQHDDRVEAHTEDGQTYTAKYLIGADGVRSTVRDQLGLAFPGKAVLSSIMLADAYLTDPPTELIRVNAVKDCFAFIAPFGDGWFRIIAWDRQQPGADRSSVDPAAIRDILQRSMGTDFGLSEIRWSSRFHSDERQVAQYRVGRVFLAGDAAHVHSPAGGQGMNTGIQDAFNLGWKLAAVLDGTDAQILDTYQEERHPIGTLVLRSSGATIRLMIVRSALLRRLRNVGITALLKIRPLSARAAGMFSGVGLRYHGQTRVPDLPLAGGTTLYAHLRSGGFVLVLAQHAPEPNAVELPAVRRTDNGPTVLVRPDGFPAWQGRDDGWRAELRRWTAITIPA